MEAQAPKLQSKLVYLLVNNGANFGCKILLKVKVTNFQIIN